VRAWTYVQAGAAAAARRAVSRRQALLRLGPDGQFRLVNLGRQPLAVNGTPVRAQFAAAASATAAAAAAATAAA
jgi:hypothetical protein